VRDKTGAGGDSDGWGGSGEASGKGVTGTKAVAGTGAAAAGAETAGAVATAAGAHATAGTAAAAAVKRPSLATRSFIVIWLVNFFNAVVFLLLMVVMSKVAADRFGASTAVAGLTASIFVIGSFVLRPVLGRRMHQFGQTKVLYAGSIFSLLLTLAYFLANSNGLLLLIRFLHGAAHGTTALAAGTIVAGVVPRERYGEGIGYFTLGATLSTAIGPFVGLFLIRRGGFQPIVITCAVLLVLALAALPFLGVKDLKLTAEQRSETKGFKLSNYIEPKALPVCLSIMVSYLCYSSVSSFLALYSQEIRLTTAASVFFIVYAVMIFVTRPVLGRWFDIKGENSVIYPSIILFAFGLGIMAIAAHAPVLLLAAAVMGLGFGGIQAFGRALTVKLTPPHRMAQATSTFYIFGDTGLGIGPLLCGLLIPVTGYRGMYGIMAGLTLVSLGLYHVLHGRRVAART
jgi:MFS family permease